MTTPVSVTLQADPPIEVTGSAQLPLAVSIVSGGPRGPKGDKGDPGDSIVGPQGPQGASIVGPQGPPGEPGSGAKTFIFQQLVPASPWVFVHNLDKYPSVYTEDSAGTPFEGDVTYPNINTVSIDVGDPVGGTAYLN